MKRAAAFALSIACVMFVAEKASAQERIVDREKGFASPQWFAVEFRFSPYWPQIDDNPSVSGNPYHTVYGDMARVLPALEVDVQPLKIPHFGNLGVGASIGYTQMSAPALIAGTTTPSGSDTNLEVIPFYGVAVLRIDVLERDASIPIVPYAKAGIAATMWRSFTNAGTSVYQGTEGTGTKWGPQLAVGVGLSLNWIDRRAARRFDTAAGINDSMIFAEWMWNNVGGSESSLWVGTSIYVFGLALQF